MTEDEFFLELAALPRRRYRFEVLSDDSIRCAVNDRCLCPIEALYFARTGRLRVGAGELARYLGLADGTRARIIRAADSRRRTRRRTRLLQALGLQEAA